MFPLRQDGGGRRAARQPPRGPAPPAPPPRAGRGGREEGEGGRGGGGRGGKSLAATHGLAGLCVTPGLRPARAVMTSSRKLPDLPPPTHTHASGGWGPQRACVRCSRAAAAQPPPAAGRGAAGGARPFPPRQRRSLDAAGAGSAVRAVGGCPRRHSKSPPRKGSTARPPLTRVRLTSGLGRSERVLPRGAFPTESRKVGQTLREPHKGGRVLQQAASGKRCDRAA